MIDFFTIVLHIILFCKVWGMSNDVRDIRNKYLKEDDEKRRMEEDYNPTPKISKGIKPIT